MTSTWRQEEQAPQPFTSGRGTAIVHGNIAYFSYYHDIYSFAVPDKWTKLPPHEYKHFSMAVIYGKLTTIGGRCEKIHAIGNLVSLLSGGWKEILPPMTTKRSETAAVTTHTHLVVAGGRTDMLNGTDVVEVLDTNTLQWSTANSLPEPAPFPQMALHNGQIHLFSNDTVFSCSVEELPTSTTSSSNGSVWTTLADIPVRYDTSLATFKEHVLAIGGSDGVAGLHPRAAIHRYDKATNSWSVIGQLPTPLSGVLTAVLPSNEVIVVGGWKCGRRSYDTYVMV